MSVTVELDEQTAALVQKLAADEHRSASEVIHDALIAYAETREPPLPEGAGKYRSVRTDTSTQVDPPARKWGDGILRTAGALADDTEWDAIMQTIQQERKLERRPPLEEEWVQ